MALMHNATLHHAEHDAPYKAIAAMEVVEKREENVACVEDDGVAYFVFWLSGREAREVRVNADEYLSLLEKLRANPRIVHAATDPGALVDELLRRTRGDEKKSEGD